MRRLKVGDVFFYRSERGYRFFQLAYTVERRGRYYRVFPGFYSEIPQDLRSIISGEYSFMIGLNVTTAFREGVFQFLGNYKECITEPFPKHDISFVSFGDYGHFTVCEYEYHQHFETFDGPMDGSGLPEKYKDVKLINAITTSLWFIYLLSSGFDLSHWDLYIPKEKLDPIRERYGELLGEK